tara:strand:+ start:645 stop:911 length:267 start_codon:yes stop_codon:yes gene_type:complete
MFILCLKGKENEGAYALQQSNSRVLLLFEEEEDAERFSGLLAADDFPELVTVEVDAEHMVDVCERSGYAYTIVTSDELLVPSSHNDLL